MHDGIYENQDRLGLPLLFALAGALGLSEAGLRNALVTRRIRAQGPQRLPRRRAQRRERNADILHQWSSTRRTLRIRRLVAAIESRIAKHAVIAAEAFYRRTFGASARFEIDPTTTWYLIKMMARAIRETGCGARPAHDRAGGTAAPPILSARPFGHPGGKLGAAGRHLRDRAGTLDHRRRFPASSRTISMSRSRRTCCVVAGLRRLPAAARGAAIHRLEIPHGRFERRIRLPAARLELDRSELANGCLFVQPDEAILRANGEDHGRQQQAQSQPSKSEPHPPLPPERSSSCRCARRCCFPAWCCRSRSGGRPPSLPLRRRSAANGCSASCCRPIPSSRIRTPEHLHASALPRRSSATSPRRTARTT